MNRFSKMFAAVIALVAVLTLSLTPATSPKVYAASSSDEDIYRENSEVQKIFHKLGRGVVNLLTGWVEIPKTVAKEWRRTDPFTGTVMGLVKGIVWAVARTFAGFYEIISFPFPVPRNYEPILEPEFVLPTVWGERLPLYRDEFMGTNGAIDSAVDYGSAARLSDPASHSATQLNSTTNNGAARSY